MTTPAPADPIVTALRLALAEIAETRRARAPHSLAGAESTAAPASLPIGPSEASQAAPRRPGRASQDGPWAVQTPVLRGPEQIGGQRP
jgi:hypothetical protein